MKKTYLFPEVEENLIAVESNFLQSPVGVQSSDPQSDDLDPEEEIIDSPWTR